MELVVLMNVLLVRPPFPDSRNSVYKIPVGLLKIASWRKSLGDEVYYTDNLILDETIPYTEINIVYVTTTFTYFSQYVIDTINFYKKICKNAKVIAGGIYASIAPNHIKDNSVVDDIVVGIIPSAEKFYPMYELLSTVSEKKKRNNNNKFVLSKYEKCSDVINDTQIIWASRGCKRVCDHCLHEDSVILTDEGHKKIKNIVESDKYYEVYSENGKFNEIDNVSCRDYNGDILEIILGNTNIPIICTPEHQFYVSRNDNIQWIYAKDILPSDKFIIRLPDTINTDYIDVYELLKYNEYGFSLQNQFGKLTKIEPIIEENHIRFIGGKQRIKKYIKIDNDFLKLGGYYLSEGYCIKTSNRPNSWTCHLAFGYHEMHYVNECIDLIHKVFGIETTFHKNKTSLIVHFKSTIASAVMETLFGGNAKGKKIHKLIYTLPPEKLKYLIEGYINGDGCTKSHTVRSGTVSESLAFGIQMIAFKCGYYASVRRYKTHESCGNIQGRKVNFSPYVYHQYFSTNTNIKNNELLKLRTFNYDKYILINIIDVVKKPYSGKVYNLQVSNSPTYTVNNLVTHNCFVHVIEPEIYFKSVDEVKKEILHFRDRKNILFYDNSIAQHPDLERLLNMLKIWHENNGYVYNAVQGWDGRMLKQWKEKGINIFQLIHDSGFYDLRFSYDWTHQKESVYYCITEFEKVGYKRKDIQIYVIINTKETPGVIEKRYFEIYSLGCQIHSDLFKPANLFTDKTDIISTEYGWTEQTCKNLIRLQSSLNYATRMGILYANVDDILNSRDLNKGKSSNKLSEYI